MHIDIHSLKTFKVSGPSSYCSVIGKSTECSMMTFRCVILVPIILHGVFVVCLHSSAATDNVNLL